MNWIATAFEALKARVEAHIPATNQALNDLNGRVTGVEAYTTKSVEVLRSGQQDIDGRTRAGFEQAKASNDALASRIAALEAKAKAAQP